MHETGLGDGGVTNQGVFVCNGFVGKCRRGQGMLRSSGNEVAGLDKATRTNQGAVNKPCRLPPPHQVGVGDHHRKLPLRAPPHQLPHRIQRRINGGGSIRLAKGLSAVGEDEVGFLGIRCNLQSEKMQFFLASLMKTCSPKNMENIAQTPQTCRALIFLPAAPAHPGRCSPACSR